MISPLLIVKRVAQGNDTVAMVVASFNIPQSDNQPVQPIARSQRSIQFEHSEANSNLEQEIRGQ